MFYVNFKCVVNMCGSKLVDVGFFIIRDVFYSGVSVVYFFSKFSFIYFVFEFYCNGCIMVFDYINMNV